MTIQQRALLDIAKVGGLGALAGAVITAAAMWIGYLPTVTVLVLIAAIYFGKTAYDIRVTQLTWERERIERELKR